MNKTEMEAMLKSLNERVTTLEGQVSKVTDRRGPKSEREMTDADARAIMGDGEHSKLSHKEAAEKLGLSYAQVYSCRKGFTFKHIHKEIEKAKTEANQS